MASDLAWQQKKEEPFFLAVVLKEENVLLLKLVENKPKTLRRSSEFERIKKLGKRQVLNSWLLISYLPNETDGLRFGCTITKKVGPAVIRNKLKRWSREFFRKSAENDENLKIDINLVFKPMGGEFYKKLKYTEFEKALVEGFKRIRKAS